MVAILLGNETTNLPCRICNAVDHGPELHSGFMENKCRCCGSIEHTLLSIATDELGKTITIPTCPITDYGDMTIQEQLIAGHIKYRPCEEKFAEHYGYNDSQIEEALLVLFNHGIGEFASPYSMMALYKRIYEICEQVRSTWTFKRTRSQLKPSEEEDAQDL